MSLYTKLVLPALPPMTWPPSNDYEQALQRAADVMREAEPWTLATIPGEAWMVARRRTWWMRVVTWWLNLHVRAYLRALGREKAEAIARAVSTPNRNGG